MYKKFIITALFLVFAALLFGQDDLHIMETHSIADSQSKTDTPLVTFNAGVNMWWIPFQHMKRDDGKTIMGTALGRDSNRNQGPQAVIGAIAETDTMGLRVELLYRIAAAADATAFSIGEWLTAWWQPVDFFKLELGNFNNEIFWGKIDDSWMKAFTTPMYSNDAIFTRFQGQGGVLGGFNYNNAFVGIMVPKLTHFGGSVGGYETVYGNDTAAGTSTAKGGQGELLRVYETVQAAIGYSIPGIGLLRAQYIGENKVWASNSGTEAGAPAFNAYVTPRIEAAFNLTVLENLNLDIGFKYFLPLSAGDAKSWDMLNQKWEKPEGSEWSTYKAPMQAAIGASWEITDDITFNGRVDAKFGSSFDSKTVGIQSAEYGPQINVHIWPTYNLGFATLGLSLGFVWWDKGTFADGSIVYSDGLLCGAGLYLEKKHGSWSVAGGVAYSPPTVIAEGVGTGRDVKSTGLLTIPITLEYKF